MSTHVVPTRSATRALVISLIVASWASIALAQGVHAPGSRSGAPPAGDIRALATRDAPAPMGAAAVYVGPHDVQPSETELTSSTANGEPYAFLRGVRGKSGLELLGRAADSGGTFCFGSGLDLPDGARIVAVAAILADPDGPDAREDAAEAFLQERPWTETRAATLAALDAQGGGYEWTVATGGELPARVDRAANEYRLMACIRGDGGFLGARVTYLRP